ncbi:hypothetical protein, partial [Pseudoalteromonas piscicida]|uniref:hypothetical protein n=1 Tax=Pseudoalteromonas piscicida TaxID=43662 RepID=UPI001A8E01BA
SVGASSPRDLFTARRVMRLLPEYSLCGSEFISRSFNGSPHEAAPTKVFILWEQVHLAIF